MKRSLLILFGLLVVASLVLSACGGGSTPAPTVAPTQAPEPTQASEPTAAPAGGATLPEVNPLEVKGDIIAAGSSTVYPLAEALAELFVDEGYAGNITIDSIGSGAGFERFCKAGETDISNASRAIKESEIESCGQLTPPRQPVEFKIGTDALAVVVNPANDWIGPEGITKAELAKLFSSEATNWSDVNPAWPAAPIKRFSPGTDSGTFDYFVEVVMDPVYVVDKEADNGKGEQQLLGAANLQLSEDDNVLVQGVEGDKYAIGYFGYAYFEENASRLKDAPIDGVSPSAETVDAGEYPLARPLFMYSDAGVMKGKPQVAAFLNFVLSRVNDVIAKVGYFPASQESLEQARQTWLTTTGQ